MRYFLDLPMWSFPIIILIAAWTLFWKGAALWQAARRKNGGWFILLLVINSLGILELIYLFGFAKVKSDKLFK